MVDLIEETWAAIGGDEATVARLAERPRHTGSLPSSFAVEAFAAAAMACVGLAVAELTRSPSVRLDPAGIAEAVRSEQALRIGDEPPASVWDPLSKIYPAADGWVRLHGNYAQHRAGIGRYFRTVDPELVAAAIAACPANETEFGVHAAGGVAAAARTLQEWRNHPHGAGVGDHPLVGTLVRSDRATAPWAPNAGAATPGPLAGLRVLELTRVIAGPVAGRTLSWFGAEVLRIESPGHQELLTLTVDTGPGKRSAQLDLKSAKGRATFEQLLSEADVLLHGLRPGAMSGLGLNPPRRAALAPGLIDACLSAYGPGPWSGRRGFDSLVQLSSGVGLGEATAAESAGAGPRALPCQILDHTTGLLMAAGIIRGVQARSLDGAGRTVTGCLARTAAQLAAAPRIDRFPPSPPVAARPGTLTLDGPFGRTHHAPVPITIDGVASGWRTGPPLPGWGDPAWLPR